MITPDKCPECGQYKSTTVAHDLTQRSRQLIAEGRINLGPLPEAVSSRLVDHPLFRFGLDDFIPDVHTDFVVAYWRCALKNPERYFACIVAESPNPQEYQKGGLIALGDCGQRGLPGYVRHIDDDTLADLLNGSLEALRLYVVQACETESA